MNLAILQDNEELFLWEYRILEELIDSGNANIILFVINDVKYSEEVNIRDSMFYLLHEKLDKFLFKKRVDFDNKVNARERFKETPVLKLSTYKDSHGYLRDSPNNFHNYSFDLILNFANKPLLIDLLKASRYGVLTYNIGDYIDSRITPSCYWEVVKNRPEIEATIKIVNTDQRQENKIFKTAVLPHPNSININRNNIYGLATLIIPRIIEGINKNGMAYIKELARKYNNTEELNGYAIKKTPSSSYAILNLLMLFRNFVVRKLLYCKAGEWFLIFKLNHKNELYPTDFSSFKVLKAPRQRFWADPFILSKDHYHYIFIEEYLYKTGKAHISVLKLDENGNLLSNERIIERPYHLSYPHVFEYDESYYMVPESGSNKTIELYKCSSFPSKWVFVRNIMENINAKDSTLFFYDNKWWLFTSIIEKSTSTISFNELFLYYSNDLFTSNWQSHPKNPIVSDHKLSRPAGKIFIDDNKIYRPSQDCSVMYGKALNINCITKLSETEYEEELIKKIEPTWDKKIIGTHTYNFNEKIIVMDVFSERRRFTGNY